MYESLWRMDDLQKYFKSSKSTIYRTILCQKTFPKAVSMKGFGKRWVPEEVNKWALRQRDT